MVIFPVQVIKVGLTCMDAEFCGFLLLWVEIAVHFLAVMRLSLCLFPFPLPSGSEGITGVLPCDWVSSGTKFSSTESKRKKRAYVS